MPDSRFEWIGGAYYRSDKVDKTDDFIGETYLSVVTTGPLANALATLERSVRVDQQRQEHQFRRVWSDCL
jgi:hypothetical protein